MEDKNWYPKYEKLSVIVFTENPKEKQKYFNLFRLILKNDIELCIVTPDRKEIHTSILEMKFYTKTLQPRGRKAHYVLNLTQDKEFNDCVLPPITIINDYLKYDERWRDLFEGMELK